MEVQYISRIVIAAMAFIVTVIGLFCLQVLFQWIKALHSNVEVSYFRLLGMRLRKVPIQTIIDLSTASFNSHLFQAQKYASAA